jgi:dTDP-glucose 4,6-dehydratase
MRLLVSGALGFIGTNFIRGVLDKPEIEGVTGFDVLNYAAQLETREDLRAHPKFNFIAGDLTSKSDLFKVLQLARPTHVLHLGAQTHVDRSIQGPDIFFQTNVTGTQLLLEAIRHWEPQIELFLHVSTDEVYGAHHGGRGYTETQPLDPTSPYAASKAAAEQVCAAYRKTYGLPVMIVRPTNNYGPWQHEEKFIPKAVTLALAGLPIPIYGDGKQIRDWLHVQDHVAALWLCLRQGQGGDIFNIAGANRISNLYLAMKILQLAGQGTAKFVEDRLAHDSGYWIDSVSLEDKLGWRPEIKFDKGLAETVAWYRERLKQPTS